MPNFWDWIIPSIVILGIVGACLKYFTHFYETIIAGRVRVAHRERIDPNLPHHVKGDWDLRCRLGDDDPKHFFFSGHPGTAEPRRFRIKGISLSNSECIIIFKYKMFSKGYLIVKPSFMRTNCNSPEISIQATGATPIMDIYSMPLYCNRDGEPLTKKEQYDLFQWTKSVVHVHRAKMTHEVIKNCESQSTAQGMSGTRFDKDFPVVWGSSGEPHQVGQDETGQPIEGG